MGSLKLLMLEDSNLDAELILREIKKMERDFEIRVVSQKMEFEKAVVDWTPDLIISDFNLQTFAGDEALAFAKHTTPETPFITLSGSITKQMEVTLLEERANDVLSKDNLKRLPFAINRVLNEKKERKKLKNTLVELEENLKFQEALANISIHFNSHESFEEKISHSLEVLGTLANVSRVYVFEDFNEGKYSKNTFEWCADGVEPEIENLQNVAYAEISTFKDVLIKKGRIYINDVETQEKNLKNHLKAQNIQALIVYPMKIGDAFLGFIGFDEVRNKREWSSSEDKLLKSVSGIISNAYSEKMAKRKLEDANKELSKLLEEKEVLVGEVHHRVKNNLALISSFLQLDQMGLGSFSSPQKILSANIIRIKSISIVHEIVYQHGSFAKISVIEIFKKIMIESYSEKGGAAIKVARNEEVPNVTFNINQAVPFSLLLSEIMFQVLSIEEENKYISSNEVVISVEQDEDYILVHLEEAELVRILSLLKKGDEYRFSEIIEVLGRQLSAEFILCEKNNKASIKFEAKNVKGASSALK